MNDIFGNEIEEARSFEAFDIDNFKIAIGNLDYVGEKVSVFSVSEFIEVEDKISGYIRMESKVNYEEVYSASVDRVENNKIFLKSIRNISADLKEDIKVDCKRNIVLKGSKEGDEVFVDAKMIDISSGGMGVTSNEHFNIGQVLEIETPILNVSSKLKIEILRREKMGRFFKYGCRFVELTSIEESNIRQAVYRLQIEEHRSRFGR